MGDPQRRPTTFMIVRLHYEDGKTEDHPLKDGVEFADYIRRIDVPGSKFAFALRGQQLRYLTVSPNRQAPLDTDRACQRPRPAPRRSSWR